MASHLLLLHRANLGWQLILPLLSFPRKRECKFTDCWATFIRLAPLQIDIIENDTSMIINIAAYDFNAFIKYPCSIFI